MLPAMLREKFGSVRRIVVAEGRDRRAAQLGASPNAGMSQLIDEGEIALADERRNDAGIREVARAEDASGLGPFERGELAFQLGIKRMIAGDQTGRTGPGAEAADRSDRGLAYRRMLAEIEIVVAREG